MILLSRAPRSRDLVVVATAVVMILAQLAFRGWALFTSYFFYDDYSLMIDAREQPLGSDYLLTPWNSHLMPGGRLLVWLVAHAGRLEWGLAVSTTLVVQAACSVAALWMLLTLFGTRWAVLAPLGVYLTSAITVPALMWWTASLNQISMQLAFFVAVAAWFRYTSSGRLRWALVAYGGIGFGLLFDVKSLLVLPVLAVLTLAHATTGRPRQRVRSVLVRWWPAALVGLPVFLAYVAYYTTQVDQPFVPSSPGLVGRLAQSMIGTGFVTGALGGPWRWDARLYADPPDWTVHASWVVAAGVVAWSLLRREGAGRAWLLLAGYVTALLALLVGSRAPVFGAVTGLEYRFQTDVVCMLTLAVALAFLPLREPWRGSTPRARPLLVVALPPRALVGLVALVCVGGIVSSTRYVVAWQDNNASDAYIHHLVRASDLQGEVDLADSTVPDAVMTGLLAPDNHASDLASLVSDDLSFPDATSRLGVVTDEGELRAALLDVATRSLPGPREGCGWLVRERGREIPLAGAAFDFTWWLRIGYLAGQDSPVTVVAGDSRIETRAAKGLNNLWVKVDGGFDAVRIEGLDSGASMCVDTVEVGQPVAGGNLS